jgi:hypothetical protein
VKCALLSCVFAACSAVALSQVFPTDLAKSTALPSRDALLAAMLADVPLFALSSVTFVGGLSPALFAGAETRWNALFGYAWLPAPWRDSFLPRPRLVVARASVPSFVRLCTVARFELYGVDRVPQGALVVIERVRTNPYTVLRGVVLGGLLDGSGAGATLYGDEVFVNNLVVQLDLSALIARATRAC